MKDCTHALVLLMRCDGTVVCRCHHEFKNQSEWYAAVRAISRSKQWEREQR